MPSILKELKLTELSLVDRPANPLAMAPIFKRDDSKGEDMEQEIETLKADAEKLKAENERLRKSLIDNGYVIKAESIEKKETPEFIEIEGEQINKADVPAPILKKLEEAEVAKAEAALEKRASEELPNFDKEVAKELLKADFDEKVLEALKAADAAFDRVMSEMGEASTEADMVSATEKMDALVKVYKDENKVTKEKAYAAVVKTAEGKALLKEIYKKED